MIDRPGLSFFTDGHIDRADQLRQRGIEVSRCEDIGMKSVPDEQLLEYATRKGYALLSMDDDMTRLNAKWRKENKHHCGIFYAPMKDFQGQAGIGRIVRHCAEWAELIEDGAGTLEEDIHNQLHFIPK